MHEDHPTSTRSPVTRLVAKNWVNALVETNISRILLLEQQHLLGRIMTKIIRNIQRMAQTSYEESPLALLTGTLAGTTFLKLSTINHR